MKECRNEGMKQGWNTAPRAAGFRAKSFPDPRPATAGKSLNFKNRIPPLDNPWPLSHGLQPMAYGRLPKSPIFLLIPSNTSASPACMENRLNIRRNFSSANSLFRGPTYPLFTSASSSTSPIRSTTSISANSFDSTFVPVVLADSASFGFEGAGFSLFFFSSSRSNPFLRFFSSLRVLCPSAFRSSVLTVATTFCSSSPNPFLPRPPNSYNTTAAACPRFIDRCASRVGIRSSQWQKLNSSFDNPHFSDPNSTATRPIRILLCSNGDASARSCSGCFNSRFPTEVVPTTSEQSATASAIVANSFAPAITSPAPTADRASLHAFPYGSTARNSAAPKLLIARATAPKFSGFRVRTSTTTRLSSVSLTPAVYGICQAPAMQRHLGKRLGIRR